MIKASWPVNFNQRWRPTLLYGLFSLKIEKASPANFLIKWAMDISGNWVVANDSERKTSFFFTLIPTSCFLTDFCFIFSQWYRTFPQCLRNLQLNLSRRELLLVTSSDHQIQHYSMFYKHGRFVKDNYVLSFYITTFGTAWKYSPPRLRSPKATNTKYRRQFSKSFQFFPRAFFT